jgi:hypothetical protein
MQAAEPVLHVVRFDRCRDLDDIASDAVSKRRYSADCWVGAMCDRLRSMGAGPWVAPRLRC